MPKNWFADRYRWYLSVRIGDIALPMLMQDSVRIGNIALPMLMQDSVRIGDVLIALPLKTSNVR